MRAWARWGIVLMVACGSGDPVESALVPEAMAEARAPQAMAEARAQPPSAEALAEASSGPSTGARSPAAPPGDEPFDFWRVLIEPETFVGTEQTCVVARVDDVSDRERRLMPAHRGKPALTVHCIRDRWRDVEAAHVVVVGQGAPNIVASTRDPRAPDVESRVRVRVLGIEARGETVNVELLSASQVTLTGDQDPTQPPSRCCVRRHRERAEPEPEVGFDFDTWTRHIGTRRRCIGLLPTAPRRAQNVVPAPIHVPPEIVLVSHASCRSAAGRKRVRLLFSASAAPSARWLMDEARIDGVIDSSGDLLVTSVTTARR